MALVETDALAGDLETALQKLGELAISDHPAPKTWIVVAAAPQRVHAAHDVSGFERVVALEPVPEQILDFPGQTQKYVAGLPRTVLPRGFEHGLDLVVGEKGNDGC